eukprot:COSAG01_NODE_6784_length_3499_cov_4.194706_3_plen_149_part_00
MTAKMRRRLLGLLEHYMRSGAAAEQNRAVDVHAAERRLRTAGADAERAKQIWAEIGDERNRAETLNLVGSLLKERGLLVKDHVLLDTAEKYLRDSLAIRQRLCSRGDKTLGQSENTLGDFFLMQRNLEQATEHYNRAREHYVEALGPT